MPAEVYDIYIGSYRFRSNTLNPLVMPRWTLNHNANGVVENYVETWTIDGIYYANTQAELWSDFNTFKDLVLQENPQLDARIVLNGTNVLTMLVADCENGPNFRDLVIKDEPGTYANQIQFTLTIECSRVPAGDDVLYKRRSHNLVVATGVEEHEWTIRARGDGAKNYVMNPVAAFGPVTRAYVGEFGKSDSVFKKAQIQRKALTEDFDTDTYTAVYSTVRPTGAGGGGGGSIKQTALQYNETVVVDYPLKPLRFLPMFKDNATPRLSVGRLQECTINYNVTAQYRIEEDAKNFLNRLHVQLEGVYEENFGGNTDFKAPNKPVIGPFDINGVPEYFEVVVAAEFKFIEFDERRIKRLVPWLYKGWA